MPTRLSLLGVALSLATTSCASAFQLRMAVGGDVHQHKKPQRKRPASSATAPSTDATHQSPAPVMDSIRTTATPPTNLNGAPYLETSPFHCSLYDELGRPWTKEGARPTLEGRSWHATLQLPLAKQMLMDAARAQSVSRDVLLDSAHMVEYDSLFGAGQGGEEGREGEGGVDVDLDGVWRLRFNAGAAFLETSQDKWGYLVHENEGEEGREEGGEEAPVCLRIDSGASTVVVDALQGPAPKSFQGTFWKDDKNTMHVDFFRVQLLRTLSRREEEEDGEEEEGREEVPMLPPGDLPVVNAFLRPGASMHVIAVDEDHLTVRYLAADAPESSLLIFSKVAVLEGEGAGEEEVEEEDEVVVEKGEKKVIWGIVPRVVKKAAVAAVAATTPKKSSSTKKDKWGHVSKAAREEQPRYANADEEKAARSHRVKMLGGYDSVYDYFEQEGTSLFLVLAFPAFLKVAPGLIAAAQVKLLLLQELASKMGDMWQ